MATSKKTCLWTGDFEGFWETECDNTFVLNEGTPVQNDFKYCPYCGRKIAQVEFKEYDSA